MAPEIALTALGTVPAGSTILDPMCGGGTVVLAAVLKGHRVIAGDIDPLAILISKTSVMPATVAETFDAERIVALARDRVGQGVVLPWIDNDESTLNFINFWFANRQVRELRALAHVIRGLSGARRIYASVSLSRTIITKSGGASLAADTSHSRPHKVRTENDFDVFEGFIKAAGRIGRVIESNPYSLTNVIRRDARRLSGVPSESIDLIVTSPPYVNAIDYLRGHRLSLVWLGYPISRLKDMSKRYMGSEKKRSEAEQQFVEGCAYRELPKVLQRTLARYISDMAAVTHEMYRVLKPTRHAVLVVGNSTLSSVYIDSAQIIRNCAESVGLRLNDQYVREIPEDSRYLPPPSRATDDKLSRRMEVETVMSFAKPG
jgi:SAM-dependent methyltransferase